MIKWFDADKFLPGRETGDVLIRIITNKVINKPEYHISTYLESKWLGYDNEVIAGGTRCVTHWAHINEPFE